jgi:hypothetical protein
MKNIIEFIVKNIEEKIIKRVRDNKEQYRVNSYYTLKDNVVTIKTNRYFRNDNVCEDVTYTTTINMDTYQIRTVAETVIDFKHNVQTIGGSFVVTQEVVETEKVTILTTTELQELVKSFTEEKESEEVSEVKEEEATKTASNSSVEVKVFFKVFEQGTMNVFMVIDNKEIYHKLTSFNQKETVWKRSKEGKAERNEIPIIQAIVNDITRAFCNKNTTVFWNFFDENNIFCNTYYEMHFFEATERKVKTRINRYGFTLVSANTFAQLKKETEEIETKIYKAMEERIEAEEKQLKETQIKINEHKGEGDIQW